MSFLTTFESDLNNAVQNATSFADLVDKYAQLASAAAGSLPDGVGPDVTAAAQVVAALDSGLHALVALLPGSKSSSVARPTDAEQADDDDGNMDGDDGDSDGGD